MSEPLTAATKASEDTYGSGLVPKRPLELVRGEGAFVWDAAGTRYLDCVAGVGVANVGHCHPRVVAALREQAGELITCYENAYHPARAALYEALAPTMPGSIDRFFLCNSGTEAVEAALKVARAATGRPGVVSFLKGYHGKTFGALSATGQPAYKKPVEPLLEGFEQLRYDDVEKLEARFAEGEAPAAVVLELIQGEGGVRPASAEFVAAVRRLCSEHGSLMIADEVQTGVGRTGTTWACQGYDVTPDVLCSAKALGGGVPIGLAAWSHAAVGELPSRVHSSTFGGNPLACRAAAAVLSVLVDEELPERAARLGARFRERVQALELAKVREVRGRGLMLGVDLRERAGRYLRPLMDRGILALLAGPTVLRFLPPLTVPEADLDRVVDALGEVLK